MKRLLCLLCALLCALTLVSCDTGSNEGDTSGTAEVFSDDTSTDTTEPTETPEYSKEELFTIVSDWRKNTSWDITFTSAATIVDDGDTENANGYFVGFDGAMIPGEKGNMYHGDTLAFNSYFAFEMAYEMYYYDGWAYQIYKDPSGVEELDSYQRYETTEEYFRADFDGIAPIFVTETEFMSGEVSVAEGTTVISIALGDGRARDELLGDIDLIAENNGVSVEDIVIADAVISYAVKDGKMIGFIGSFTLEFNADGVMREYSLEKSAVINAVGEEVETFTLPEDADSYEIY